MFLLAKPGKKNKTIEWDDGGKISNKNKLILNISWFSYFYWCHKIFRLSMLNLQNKNSIIGENVELLPEHTALCVVSLSSSIGCRYLYVELNFS